MLRHYEVQLHPNKRHFVLYFQLQQMTHKKGLQWPRSNYHMLHFRNKQQYPLLHCLDTKILVVMTIFDLHQFQEQL